VGEWDDERASVTGREITGNIPGKMLHLSRRDRRVLALVYAAPIVLLLVIVALWTR
jgi:hypothetical protein